MHVFRDIALCKVFPSGLETKFITVLVVMKVAVTMLVIVESFGSGSGGYSSSNKLFCSGHSHASCLISHTHSYLRIYRRAYKSTLRNVFESVIDISTGSEARSLSHSAALSTVGPLSPV